MDICGTNVGEFSSYIVYQYYIAYLGMEKGRVTLLVIPQRYPSSSHPGTLAVLVGYRITAGVPNSPLSEVKYQCIRTCIHHIK
jgi:hypothetical protein